MPLPWSRTRTSTFPSSSFATIATRLPSGENFNALSTRFERIRSVAAESPAISAGFRLGFEGDSARGGERLEAASECLEDRNQRKTTGLELQSSQEQKIAQQAPERRDFGEAGFGSSAAGVRFREGSQAKLDGDQRGLDLVREPPREIDVVHEGLRPAQRGTVARMRSRALGRASLDEPLASPFVSFEERMALLAGNRRGLGPGRPEA